VAAISIPGHTIKLSKRSPWDSRSAICCTAAPGLCCASFGYQPTGAAPLQPSRLNGGAVCEAVNHRLGRCSRRSAQERRDLHAVPLRCSSARVNFLAAISMVCYRTASLAALLLASFAALHLLHRMHTHKQLSAAVRAHWRKYDVPQRSRWSPVPPSIAFNISDAQ
jgi:hypothetical protein